MPKHEQRPIVLPLLSRATRDNYRKGRMTQKQIEQRDRVFREATRIQGVYAALVELSRMLPKIITQIENSEYNVDADVAIARLSEQRIRIYSLQDVRHAMVEST